MKGGSPAPRALGGIYPPAYWKGDPPPLLAVEREISPLTNFPLFFSVYFQNFPVCFCCFIFFFLPRVRHLPHQGRQAAEELFMKLGWKFHGGLYFTPVHITGQEIKSLKAQVLKPNSPKVQVFY